MEVLEVPTLLQNTLKKAGVTTLDDLLKLDLEVVTALPGVGRKRVRLFRLLQEEARKSVRGEAGDDGSNSFGSAASTSPHNAALRAATVVALAPRSGLGGVLRKHEVRTLGDLIDVPPEQLRSTRGVGPLKIEALETLLDRAHRVFRLAASTDPEDGDTALFMGLSRNDIDLSERWENVLVGLPVWAIKALHHSEFITLADVVAGVTADSLLELPMFGRKTVDLLREHITQLASLGRVNYRLEGEGRP